MVRDQLGQRDMRRVTHVGVPDEVDVVGWNQKRRWLGAPPRHQLLVAPHRTAKERRALETGTSRAQLLSPMLRYVQRVQQQLAVYHG
jgi:hypothetical protein